MHGVDDTGRWEAQENKKEYFRASPGDLAKRQEEAGMLDELGKEGGPGFYDEVGACPLVLEGMDTYGRFALRNFWQNTYEPSKTSGGSPTNCKNMEQECECRPKPEGIAGPN